MKEINIYGLFNNSYVPMWLQRRTEISDGAKLLYGLLARYAGKDGKCYPLQKRLCNDLNRTPRTIKKYVSSLKKFKLISTKQRGLNGSNNYKFYSHKWMYEYKDTFC